MKQAELFGRLSEYGADIGGVRSRFKDNADLYKACFLSLLHGASITQLQKALASENYEQALEAARELKGIAENLGLTPFCNAVCVLYESLKNKNYDGARAEIDAVKREFARLENLLPDYTDEESRKNASAPCETKDDAPNKEPKKPARKRVKGKLPQWRFALLAIVSLLLVISFGAVMFINLIGKFYSNIDVQSASHLEEINYQIRLYIEGEIENDWQVAYGIRNAFIHNVRDNDDTNISEFLTGARDVWQVDDIIIFTDDGSGVRTNGEKLANDVASSTILNAIRYGENTSIIQSTIIYTIPIETELSMNGSRIAALSVERNLQSFLDSMEFSSFGGEANVYLTENTGKIISRLTTEGAARTFNITSEFQKGEFVCLTNPELTAEDVFSSRGSTTFRLSRADSTDYVVITPIITRLEEMRLVYIVPELIVNETMDRFKNGIILLGVSILSVLLVIIVAVFIIVYKTRKRQFDKAIISREHTFDQLVTNTQTAFSLLSTRQEEPVYTSANAAAIIGAPLGRLRRTENGFQFTNADGSQPETMREINRALSEWDGKSKFSSGYIARSGEAASGYYEIFLYPATDNEDEYITIIQDVTQQFEREEAAKNALAMAERANAAKSRFLSNMSHDIRTPMNAIVNMTKFAKENKNDPALLDKYLSTISESSDHLLQLINDVLDVSRIESGQAVIESLPFDIKSELSRLVDIILPLCQNKRQSFKADFGNLRARNVLGDRLKLSQVLMNLLGNAVKFTPEGGKICFTACDLPSLRAGIAAVRFTVSDNGIGIPADNIKNIFEAFVRVDDKRVSSIEGTGLGLSICHNYIEAMGGRINCQSEEGKGSTFTVELFFEETETISPKSTYGKKREEMPFAGVKCLLCEDNAVNQLIAKTLLQRFGMEVDVASDGREGVERFGRSDDGRYDVVYMDIQMPVMDGYEASVAIRRCSHPQAKTIPIIAMTANVFAEDVEKARSCGMNGHLGKPISTEDLILETEKVLKRQNGE
ncbi:MAG: ATP-binding protein [Eubacteriales bacterium]|nr:ATP-binding protein [Eubacteriales bacterium]